MRNPLRSEGEMYRFLWIVVGGTLVIVVAAVINTWVGVAAAVIAFAALTWWFVHEPVPGAADPPKPVVSETPGGRRRILVVAPPGTESVEVPDGVEVLVVVPAVSSVVESLTGAVDDRRAEAGSTAATLGEILGARAEIGADDPALAAEDALRVFGADEVLVVGGDGWADAIRERVAIPVSRA